MNIITLAALSTENLSGLLIAFIILVIILAVAGGLIYLIELWIIKGPMPTPVRLVIGLILVAMVVIWAIRSIQ